MTHALLPRARQAHEEDQAEVGAHDESCSLAFGVTPVHGYRVPSQPVSVRAAGSPFCLCCSESDRRPIATRFATYSTWCMTVALAHQEEALG